MDTVSVWRGTARATAWPMLEGDVAADVVIVGGGITGVTLALRLAQEGRSVVLLESQELGVGSTGNSTGNLYATVSDGLHAIADKWDKKVVGQVAQSRRETVDWMERQARQLNVDCGFRRCSLYWYATSASAQESVDKEHLAATEAGLLAHIEQGLSAGLPNSHGCVLVLENQAQFHPLAYVRGLADHAAANGCRVFEHSPVLEVDRSQRVVRTPGGRVMAREVVLATHSPSGFHLVQAGMVPSQEYGLAVRLDALPPGIFWGKGDERLSTRSLQADGQTFLVCVGQQHKTGQHDASSAMQGLEALARRQFGQQEVTFRWSAQNFRSPDGLPYIGSDLSGAYIATGFGTDGLVFGTLAASIIAEQILGRANRWSELYKAGRFAPVKGAKGVLEEVTSMAKALIEDYLTPQQAQTLSSLAPGRGSIVEVGNESLAAYRDKDGTLFVVSPVCTHLKCKVRWNDMETTWDCPCHGSRFAPSGEVIEGPALAPLMRKSLPQL